MKKVVLLIASVALVATMVSCGSKTAQGGDSDSTAVADIAVADSAAASNPVAKAPAELWTEEAVEAQIRKMYDRLNDMDKRGVINIVTLEDMFCSSYYLKLRNAIRKAMEEATGDDMMFFGDEEGYRFLAGMATPLEIESIKVDLLSGDMAQAQVRFKGADEENGFMRLELDFENDAWRVKNFDYCRAKQSTTMAGSDLTITRRFLRIRSLMLLTSLLNMAVLHSYLSIRHMEDLVVV